MEHCGSSFCNKPNSKNNNCRIETSVLPFHIRVDFTSLNFGNITNVTSFMEDHRGVCLNYEQIPCSE